MTMIEPWILDISRYQITEDGVAVGRTLNWQKAWDAGIRVVAIRCTVGNWYTDPLFQAHWDGAKAIGMLTTAYHVTKPSHTYQSQMDRLFATLGDRKSDIPLVIDNELSDNKSKQAITAVIQNSVKYMADKDGRNPINYTRQSWWDYFVLDWSGWKDFPVWAAWYPNDPTTPLPCKYVPKGYDCKWSIHQFCVSPEALILTSNLEWIPAGDLRLDQELIGFDEKSTIRGLKLQRSTITNNNIIKLPTLKITLSNNEVIKCSTEHPFIVRNRNNTGSIRTNLKWMKASEIAERFNTYAILIPKYFSTWNTKQDWKSGYLAGAFDGEGSLRLDKNNTYQLQFAQNNNAMLQKVINILIENGVDYSNAFGFHNLCYKIYIKGGKAELFKILGELRPPRLLDKVFQCSDFGSITASENLQVVSVEYLGEQELVGLSTSTKTYFSDGFASHNSADGNMQGAKYGAESKSIDLSKYNGTFEQFKIQFNVTQEEPPEPPQDELSLEEWRTVMTREATKAGWNLYLE